MNDKDMKILYTKNLDKFNFNTPINLTVDANANIKTILDINCYIFDDTVECGTGKAVINGKIGVKILYIDTDNITNTISNNQNFSETIINDAITNDSLILLNNPNISTNILSQDAGVKLNIEVSYSPTMCINLTLPNISNEFENMITNKCEVGLASLECAVNTRNEYQTTFETKDELSKILGYDCQFIQSNVTAYNEYAVLEGKLFATLLYETNIENDSRIKELTDVFNVKMEISIPSLSSDYQLDLNCSLDKSRENITTEIEDDNTIISVKHEFKLTGVVIKIISMDMVEDLFSVENEIELSSSNREFTKNLNCGYVVDNISGEFNIDDNDSAIDEIISNHNISTEITNNYIKNDNLYLEGIITSHIIYLDENKEYRHKQTELPFILNTKIQMENLDCKHIVARVIDSKTKAKRGTIIELEYTLAIYLCSYECDSRNVIDNIKIGKALDFTKYDYQIFIAKPDETIWEVCKRIKISIDDLNTLNPNLPTNFQGGEKIVIKR